MELLPLVSWMRPTTPVVLGVAPTYTARLSTPDIEPSTGIWTPTAPSIFR